MCISGSLRQSNPKSWIPKSWQLNSHPKLSSNNVGMPRSWFSSKINGGWLSGGSGRSHCAASGNMGAWFSSSELSSGSSSSPPPTASRTTTTSVVVVAVEEEEFSVGEHEELCSSEVVT
nr:hypothetical protein Itr_chr13CG18090 [Ipomoea trifida]